MDKLSEEISKVVAANNCSGCGACAMLDPLITMQLNEDGFLRPTSAHTSYDPESAALVDQFRQICPGVEVTKPKVEQFDDPIFGSYVSAWVGYAVDPVIRTIGSSGGVITALNRWLLDSNEVSEVRATQGSTKKPTRAVSVNLTKKDDILSTAGSRYQPVSSCGKPSTSTSFTGKPCEVYAQRKLDSLSASERPLYLSFFCAGTPSQRATIRLINESGVEEESVNKLRYRGDGWPGNFSFTDRDNNKYSRSYEESWGEVLGRDLQFRCKICVDGTGEHADISVGDFWESDSKGFPKFEGLNDGRSVILARTARGHDYLEKAVEANILAMAPLESIEALYSVQPLQTERRITLFGRILGRRIAGKSVPKYGSFSLWRHSIRHPYQVCRALLGAFYRTRKEKNNVTR